MQNCKKYVKTWLSSIDAAVLNQIILDHVRNTKL